MPTPRLHHPLTPAPEGWEVIFVDAPEGKRLIEIAAWDADGNPLVAPTEAKWLYTAQQWSDMKFGGSTNWSIVFSSLTQRQ